MLNNIFPLIVQAAVQTPSAQAAQNPSVPAFQAAAAYIDDEIRLSIVGY